MKYIDIKEVDKTVKQQNNGGNGRTMHMHTAWYSALLVLGTALLILTGCPETPTDQVDTTAPDPITITSANITAGPSSITLQWEPSPSDDVAEVQVTWTPEDGEDQPKIIDIDSTNTTITGLNAGTPYAFSITAIDTAGNVSSVVEISATTPFAVDFAQDSYPFSGIDNIPGTTVGSVSATVVSSTPADPPITFEYQIVENNDDDSALFVINTTTAEITIGTTALDPTRDDYSFTVQATSSQGVIVTTAVVVSPSLDTTAPDPVTQVSAATTPGTTAVTLSWENSASIDATIIRIVWVETVSGTGGDSRDIAHDGTTTAVITELASEVEYTFTLTVLDNAVDAAGGPAPNESDVADASTTTSDTEPPLPVSSFTATPLESGIEAELSWTNSDSPDADMLEIAWSSSAGGASGSDTIESGMDASPYTVSGLTPVTPYTFTITVVDDAGNRSGSETADPITTLTNAVDADGDRFIDISSLEQLHNMRYNLDGTSYKTSSNDGGVRCGTRAANACRGYELTQNLDFDSDSDSNTYDQTTYALDADDHHETYFPITGGAGGWLPIGNGGNPFSTTFDGNGFFIHGLAVRRNQTYIGMFGRIDGSAIIRNIRLTNNLADYTGSSNGTIYVGGLVAYNTGTISASHAGGPADGGDGNNDRVGGLVGQNTDTITASYTTGVTNGGDGNNDRVGGLVGYNNQGTIVASHTSGNVTVGDGNDAEAGGLVGRNQGTGIGTTGVVVASYATGNVTVGDGNNGEAGGLVGYNNSGVVVASYATGNITAGDGNQGIVGGLVGNNGGDIAAGYATGNANGGAGTMDQAGGLVGLNNFSTIRASYATGNADGGSGGNDYADSLVGRNTSNGAIDASYGFGSRMGVENPSDGAESSSDLDPDAVGAGNDPGIAGARLLQGMGGAAGRSVTAAWNASSSRTYDAWNFGTDSQAPALRYADYDNVRSLYGCGSSSRTSFVIPSSVPDGSGGSTNITCRSTLLGGPQPR